MTLNSIRIFLVFSFISIAFCDYDTKIEAKNEARSCTCGQRNIAAGSGGKIVGGVVAAVNEFPWRCGLSLQSDGRRIFCGCAVIANSFIMTAAHCTVPLGNRQIYVNLAEHDVSTDQETRNVVIKAATIINHRSYNARTIDFDIALIKIETRLIFNRTISPVCLPWGMEQQNFQGTTAVASGWGTTSSGGSVSSVLLKVNIPVLTTEECRNYYGSAITNNMMCTLLRNFDTCQGDSGGSIEICNPSTNKCTAIGVVSWGQGCAVAKQPGVYSKITAFLPWIKENTSGETFCTA